MTGRTTRATRKCVQSTARQRPERALLTTMTCRVPLDPRERAILAELLALVLPSASGPGAREAGAVEYVIGRLVALDADDLPELQTLLGEAAGHEAACIERLAADDNRWFRRLRSWAWEGFLCDPSRGGNRGGVGWSRMNASPRQKAPRS